MQRLRLLAVATVLISAGCEPPVSSSTRDKSAVAVGVKAPVFAPPPDPNAKPKPFEPQMIREVARAGVSDKGKYDPGIITTPLTANFSLREQMIFDAQIPSAIKLFEGLRNRKPASHQEFMTEIIAKSNIKLPVLPSGCRYIYDPQRGELMVERPAE